MSAYSITIPDQQQNGIVFNSPHSGTGLPERFLNQISLDPSLLLYSSDLMVDRLVENTSLFGATVLTNFFARIYVDTNRSTTEIDPDMFQNKLPSTGIEKTGKVTRGFGIFSKKSYDGQEIYTEKLPINEIDYRLNHVYYPVHKALGALLDTLHRKLGFCLLLDCHSMPSYHFINQSANTGLSHTDQPDLIIGNCFTASCHERISSYVAKFFINHGLKISFNNPYAGGFNTQTYGQPHRNRQALQLEFNRALYMDEKTLTPNEGFAPLQALLSGLSENLDKNLRHFFSADQPL